MKVFYAAIILISLSLIFSSCNSLKKIAGTDEGIQEQGKNQGERVPQEDKKEETLKKEKAVLTKENERMFWKISGKDSSGKESTVFIQGTIHIGDERLYPLEQSVIASYLSADRIVAELSSEDSEKFAEELFFLTSSSYKKAEGRTVTKELSAEQRETLKQILDAKTLDFLTLLEPWCMVLAIISAPAKESPLSVDFSLDEYFSKRAAAEGRTVLGFDTLSGQLESLCSGTYSEQLESLKEILDGINGGEFFEKMTAASLALYNAYLSGDPDRLGELTSGDERNARWAEQLSSFLDKGGTTFVYAGCAHWVGEDSVFSVMKKMGVLEEKIQEGSK